jgi:glycerol-3-phosphate dehydrogenase
MNFSNLNRTSFVAGLGKTHYDLLVIGGGITGCGIALDAALRGMKVALVEKNDFASGTSSRSTKLIHGGLRYLKQLEIKLVHDVGSERAVVHRNARHVVIPEKMLLPIIEGGTLGKHSTSLGLLVYDILAGVKRTERRKMLDRHETLKAEPLLNTDKLLGGGLYFEYRTDDSRLVIELAKSAFAKGATLLNYAELTGFNYDADGKITTAKVHDKINGSDFEINATVVVNACGPWVDLLRKQDNSLKGKRLQLTKGVHIVLPQTKLPIKQAAYFDVGDGRQIFAIPRNNITYVGTTDTVYNRDIDSPRCSTDDAQYLLNALNQTFKGVNLTIADIESTWAGLRPLIHEDGKSPSELSRKDEIMISHSGLVSIAGGKLTGYRLMAEKIVDLAEKRLGKKYSPCTTKTHRLSGGEFENQEAFNKIFSQLSGKAQLHGIPPVFLKEWFYRYGTNANKLIDAVANMKDKTGDNELLFAEAEINYVVNNEMVYHLSDMLIRRTGKIFFDKPNTEKRLETYNRLLTQKLHLPESEAALSLQNAQEEFKQVTQFE